MRHQNIGQKLKVKPFAKQESRTSLGSLVTKEMLKIQHFGVTVFKIQLLRNVRFLDTKTRLVFY